MKFFDYIKSIFTRKEKSRSEPVPVTAPLPEPEPAPVIPVRAPEDTPTMTYGKLSNNFSLLEFTNSQTAKRKNIKNDPSPEHYDNLKALVTNVLQPLRDELGMPLIITSGYRAPALNRAIGGSSTSQHCKGEAADIECIGMSNKDLAKHISKHYEFDQLILEFYNPKEGPNSGWVHVSYKAQGKNRKEIMTAITDGSKTRYVFGITNE